MAIAKQLQANEIFICNTSNVDSMRHGRPQTVLIEQENLQNGMIVTLEGTKETTDIKTQPLDHVHGIVLEAQTALIGKFIVVDPEINVEQYRRIDSSLAQFGTKPLEHNATHTAYELAKYDRIEYSEAYLSGITAEQAKGMIGTVALGIDATGKLVAGDTLRVVSVREQRLPLMMDGVDAEGQAITLPEKYHMIKVEVVK